MVFRLPSFNTYGRLLQECTRKKEFAKGKLIHGRILCSTGFLLPSHTFLWNNLIHMYTQSGSIPQALALFNQMSSHNVFTWTIMISAYAHTGHPKEALALFARMQMEGVKPNKATCVSVLSGCVSLEDGQWVHALVRKSGFESDTFVGTALVGMYVGHGRLDDARNVFDAIRCPDVAARNAMIAGYARWGCLEGAFSVFDETEEPNAATLSSVLKACAGAGLGALGKGKRAHVVIAKSQNEAQNAFVFSALIDMYAKCGSLVDARRVFNRAQLPCKRDTIVWNTMISGYTRDGSDAVTALVLIECMRNEGVKPNIVTYANALHACSICGNLAFGKHLHARIAESGFDLDISLANALLDMYIKSGGDVDTATLIFVRMPRRNVASWTAIMSTCTHPLHTLSLFEKMSQEGIKPDNIASIIALNACADLASLAHGKCIHALALSSVPASTPAFANALLDMYGKCGSIEFARRTFDRMPSQNVVSFTSIIAGYALHNNAHEALALLRRMQEEAIKPDGITFLSVLSACSYRGLLSDALCIFKSMHRDHGIAPAVEHYICIIDLLGRLGHLTQAEDFINKMPVQSKAAHVWRTLLGACRISTQR